MPATRRSSSSSSSVASTSALEVLPSVRMATPSSMLEIVGSAAPASPSVLQQRPRQAVEGDLDYFVDEMERRRRRRSSSSHSDEDEFVDWTSSHVASPCAAGGCEVGNAEMRSASPTSPLSSALSTPSASVAFALAAHHTPPYHYVEELTLPGVASVLYGSAMPTKHFAFKGDDWMHRADAPLPHALANNTDVSVFSYNETYRFPANVSSDALGEDGGASPNDAALQHEKRFEEAQAALQRRLSQPGNAEWMDDSSSRAASVAAASTRQPTFARASPSPRRASFAALSPTANTSLAGGLESLAMAWWQQQQVAGAVSPSQAGMQPPAWVPAALANRRATVASGDLTPAAWFASQAYADSQQPASSGYAATAAAAQQEQPEQWWQTAAAAQQQEAIDPMLQESSNEDSTDDRLRSRGGRRARPAPLPLDTSGLNGTARSMLAPGARAQSGEVYAYASPSGGESSDFTAFMRSCEQNVGPPGLALQHFAPSSPATMEFFAGHAAGNAHNANGMLQPPPAWQQQEHRRAHTTPEGYAAAAASGSSAALLPPPPPPAGSSSWSTYSSLAQRGAPPGINRSASYGGAPNPFRSAAAVQQRARYDPYPTSSAAVQHAQRRLDGSERAHQAAYRFPDTGADARAPAYVPSGSTAPAMDGSGSSSGSDAAGGRARAAPSSSRKSAATEGKTGKGGAQRRPAAGRASASGSSQPGGGTPPPSFAPSHITREIVLRALPSSRGTEDVWYPTVDNIPRTALDPPRADFDVAAADAAERLPRSQADKMRFKGDLYTPTWVRGTGMQREAWCDKCEDGGWMQLKNSQYWYHVRGSHGISPATGRIFPPPTELRCYDDAVGTTEGFCTSCSKWVQICTAKRKRDFSGWFKHCAKCITAQSPSVAAAATAAAVASSSAAAALHQQQMHAQHQQVHMHQEQQHHPDTTARMVQLTAPSRAADANKRLRR